MASAAKTALIHRRLYRALLRAAKPFCPPSPDAAVLSCLLHRSFIPLEIDESLARQEHEAEDLIPGMHLDYDEEDDEATNGSYPKRSDAHFLLFRRLLQDVFSGQDGETVTNKHNNDNKHSLPKKRVRCLQFPSHAKERPLNLTDILRREFRVPEGDPKTTLREERFSGGFTLQARRDCAFLALKRLNEKIYWADQLEDEMAPPCPQQAAKYVTPLSISAPPSTYLKPGTFLIAHPHLGGFFRRSVIVILQHGTLNKSAKDKEKEQEKKEEEEDSEDVGTYGIVINRVSLHELSGRNRTLADVMSVLPKELVTAFGSFPVRDGGPVHMPSIQMLHACTPPDGGPNKAPSLKAIGGTRLPLTVGSDSDYSSEKAVYIQGDIMKAAEAVKTEHLDRDDVSFFIGACSWYAGQLEQEIQQGCWLPVNGPAEIALSGVCEHEPTQEGEPRPKADLWLSMMSSCGEDEARLAHLVANASEDDEYGAACDEF